MVYQSNNDQGKERKNNVWKDLLLKEYARTCMKPTYTNKKNGILSNVYIEKGIYFIWYRNSITSV